MDAWFDGELWLVRWMFQRGLAAIYLLAFIGALRQFPALLGERGLMPVTHYLARVSFREAPSVFHLRYSDQLFKILASIGIVLSLVALFGISEASSPWLSIVVWLVLWALYLSIVNVGQTFYGFGWESMLVEAGFFAAFLGSTHTEPSVIPIFALRWMLFRTELGAGLIKLRHDPCWRDCTCLYYHHETQPMPNPISWYAHRLPKWMHRAGVAFSHFVQIVVPFGLFLPQPFASVAGALIIAHQLLLILTGNYAWLNWLTVVLGITAFSDATLLTFIPMQVPELAARSLPYDIVLYALAIVTIALSVKPTLNFFSRQQKMNASYNSLHLVNSYGAFGSVTRERHEIVLEGTTDPDGDDWKSYELWGKPGDPMRRPWQFAPYHLRLDWLMWFLPLSAVRRGKVFVYGHEAWFIRLVEKLLAGDPPVLALFRHNPFPDRPPLVIRARMFLYCFTDPEQKRATGAWWTREYVGEYLPAVSASDLR